MGEESEALQEDNIFVVDIEQTATEKAITLEEKLQLLFPAAEISEFQERDLLILRMSQIGRAISEVFYSPEKGAVKQILEAIVFGQNKCVFVPNLVGKEWDSISNELSGYIPLMFLKKKKGKFAENNFHQYIDTKKGEKVSGIAVCDPQSFTSNISASEWYRRAYLSFPHFLKQNSELIHNSEKMIHVIGIVKADGTPKGVVLWVNGKGSGGGKKVKFDRLEFLPGMIPIPVEI